MKLLSPALDAGTLWERLLDAGLVEGGMPPLSVRTDTSPWFVKALLAIAAWLSSLLFLVFLALAMGSLLESTAFRAVLGMVACAAAAFYFYHSNKAGGLGGAAFLNQIFLVMVLLGQGLVLSAIFTGFDAHPGQSLLAALFEAVMLMVVRYGVNRFVSAMAALGCLYYAAMSWGLAGLFVPAVLAAFAVASFQRWRAPQLLLSLMLALAVIPIVMHSLSGPYALFLTDAETGWSLPWWVSRAGIIVVWLGVVLFLLRQMTPGPSVRGSAAVVVLALLLAAGTWTAPMALFALTVFVLGFAQRDKVLQGVGIAELLWTIGDYYYMLQETLLFKSLSLFLLGAALLVCYAVSVYNRRRDEEGARV